MSKKTIALICALLFVVACKQRVDDEPPAESAHAADEVDDELKTYRQTTRQRLQKLGQRIQEASDKIDAVAGDVGDDTAAAADNMDDDAKTMLSDVKTRLDQLGTKLNSAAASSSGELKKLKDKIDDELEKLEKDVEKATDVDAADEDAGGEDANDVSEQ